MKQSVLHSDNDDDSDVEFLMNDGDLNSILNDPELNRELMALVEETPIAFHQSHGNNSYEKANRNTDIPASPVDVNMTIQHNIDIDLNEVELTEDDLRDPELLQQFEDLSSPPRLEENEKSEPALVLGGSTTYHIPVSTQEEIRDVSIEDAKTLALKYKREGNTNEALRWYRYSKMKEEASKPSSSVSSVKQSISSSIPASKPSSSIAAFKPYSSIPASKPLKQTTPIVVPKQTDSFSSLEEALQEAIRWSLSEAKRHEISDKVKAVSRMREIKAYQQELSVLRTRRQVDGQACPLFRWETVKEKKTISHSHIPEDSVEVTLLKLRGLETLLTSHGHKTNASLSIRFNLGLTKEEECVTVAIQQQQQQQQQPKKGREEKEEGEDCLYRGLVVGLKRGRSVQQSFHRKKATFELLVLKNGWEVLAVSVVPLADLLTRCEVLQREANWMSPPPPPPNAAAAVGTSGHRGKAVGGLLEVLLRVRNPLQGLEVLEEEIRTLVVDPWPSPSSSSVMTSIPSLLPVDEKKTSVVILSEQERSDPQSVDLLESNDVLESEISLVVAQLEHTSDEDEQFSLSSRKQLLETKLQILVFRVQSEMLSMEQYVDCIRDRLVRDEKLLTFLLQKQRNEEAKAVTRRVAIVRQELKNVEEQDQEG